MFTKDFAAQVLRGFATQVETTDNVQDGTAMIAPDGRIYTRDEAVALLAKHMEFLDAIGDDALVKINRALASPKYVSVFAPTLLTSLSGLSRGFVYLMRNPENGLHKIGRSIDPNTRIHSVRAYEGVSAIDLVHCIKTDDCVWLEGKLHVLFEACRKRGEWFDLKPIDIEWLKGHAEWNRAAVTTDDTNNEQVFSEPTMYSQAVELIQAEGRASVAMLQRRFKIGFVAGVRLLEKLEEDGLVSPQVEGRMWRDVIRQPAPKEGV